MKFAIIGGGWAGMAAAQTLVEAGHDITVFEAAAIAGGRARGVPDSDLVNIDNGQHILIGAYTETLKLIHKAHPAPELVLTRLPLQWLAADGSIQIQSHQTHAGPLKRLSAFTQAQGLSRRERWQLVTWLSKVRLGFARPSAGQTVHQWLDQHHIDPASRDKLITPLCLATLNTTPQNACAQLFARVIQDSLLSPLPGAADMLIARSNLTDLWIGPLARNLTLRTSKRIREIELTDQHAQIDGETFDGAIVATTPHETSRLLQTTSHHAASDPYLNNIIEAAQSLTYNSITTCYMTLDQPWRLPNSILLLSGGHPKTDTTTQPQQSIQVQQPLQPGQWVFDRNAFLPKDLVTESAQLSFVISHADQAVTFERSELPTQLLAQLKADLQRNGHTVPDKLSIRTSRILSDRRATFAAQPGLQRPSVHTDWPHLKIAGDWTNTGYPAVLEGAILSGQEAAQALLSE